MLLGPNCSHGREVTKRGNNGMDTGRQVKDKEHMHLHLKKLNHSEIFPSSCRWSVWEKICIHTIRQRHHHFKLIEKISVVSKKGFVFINSYTHTYQSLQSKNYEYFNNRNYKSCIQKINKWNSKHSKVNFKIWRLGGC